MHWIESIQHKYPDIFEECYQFSPPDGWRTLVESLIEYVNWHNTVHKTTIRLYQVVEAFGGLKFCIQHQPNQPIIAEEASPVESSVDLKVEPSRLGKTS